jgi:hypothetical protein
MATQHVEVDGIPTKAILDPNDKNRYVHGLGQEFIVDHTILKNVEVIATDGSPEEIHLRA